MTPVAVAQSSGAAVWLANLLPIAVIVGIFYFLVIAPANKQRRKTQQMLDGLKKGDRVVTTGGIHGSIQGIENDVVYLKIADNVKIKILRSAIAGLVDEKPEDAKALAKV